MGAAADPCRAGRAAGAACFASFMGLVLKKLYLFKKEKQQEKNKGFGVVSVLGYYRDRFGWAGKHRLKRARGLKAALPCKPRKKLAVIFGRRDRT